MTPSRDVERAKSWHDLVPCPGSCDIGTVCQFAKRSEERVRSETEFEISARSYGFFAEVPVRHRSKRSA